MTIEERKLICKIRESADPESALILATDILLQYIADHGKEEAKK